MNSPKKHYLAFLFALPAFMVVLVLKAFPLFLAVVLPFKNYTFMKGFLGSPWVGLTNFQYLLSDFTFIRVLGNTLVMNFFIILVTCFFAFIIGLSLSHIRNTRVCIVLCALFSIPFFIPQVFWNVLLFKLFGMQGLVNSLNNEPVLYLARPEAARAMYITIEAIRWTGLFSSVIAFASRMAPYHEKVAATLKAVLSLALISIPFILVTDFEVLHGLANPMVYEKVDTLTLYSFRSGFVNMQVGFASSQWILQFLFCFLILLIILFAAGRFIKRSLIPHENRSLQNSRTAQTSSISPLIIIPAIYSLFLIFTFGLMFYAALDIGSFVLTPSFIQSGITYFGLALISSLIGIFLSVLLAYPLTTSSTFTGKLYAVIFIILIAAGHLGLHDYLYARSLELVNTYTAIILSGMFYPINVFLLSAYYNHKTDNTPADFGAYIKKSLPAIICLFIASFLINLDSYTSSLIYMHSHDMQSPSLQIYMGINSPR